MYTITRKNRIKEDLQLCHADGDVALTLSVDINVDDIAARVNKRTAALAVAENVLNKDPNSEAAQEAYGNSIIALFEVIFGEDGTKQLVDFYENRYTEMLLDVFPFINDEILPKIREASESRKAQLLAAAQAAKKGNRASRRHGFGR